MEVLKDLCLLSVNILILYFNMYIIGNINYTLNMGKYTGEMVVIKGFLRHLIPIYGNHSLYQPVTVQSFRLYRLTIKITVINYVLCAAVLLATVLTLTLSDNMNVLYCYLAGIALMAANGFGEYAIRKHLEKTHTDYPHV